MPQKSKKSKKKDGGRRKQETNENDRGDKNKNSGKGSTSKGIDTLTTYFNSEELQELKNTLKNKDPNTVPLALASVVLTKFDVLKKLVQKGVNVNETGPNHLTALMWAIKCKSLDVIDFLLSNGADPTIKNDNGDGVLFIAIENKLWDEKSYITLWNRIKSVSFVDVDFTSKNGRNMIHTAVRREWNEMLDILITEKANVNAKNSNGMTPLMLASYLNNIYMVTALLHGNADVLKKDLNSCTALCYAISYVINKNAQMPHLVVDKLLAAMRAKQIPFKDFLKSRIDLILNDTVRKNRSGQPLPDTKSFIISYAVRYTEGASKTLLDINIFRKIANVGEKFMKEPLQLMKLLTIINEILKSCEQYCGNGTVEKHLLETFTTNGGADLCLSILKTYSAETNFDYDFISSAFTPLIIACTSHMEGKSWLYHNCLNVAPFHAQFLSVHSTEISDDLQTKKNNENISKFNEIMKNIKKESSFFEIGNNSDIEQTKSNHNSQKFKENQKNSKESKQEQKPSSKKTKRRAKALKAKIAKIKSADLAERLNNQNGKKVLEPKCASDTSIIKNVVKSKKVENDSDKTDGRAATWSQYTHWEQIWLIDDDTHPPVQEFNHTLNVLGNHLGIDVEDDMLNVDIVSKLDLGKRHVQSNCEIVSLYPDWKNKNLLSGTDISKNFPNESNGSLNESEKWIKADFSELFASEDDSKGKPTPEEIKELLDCTLNYLSGLLSRIIITYQNHWDHDRELENDPGDINYKYDKVHNTRTAIEKLEMEYIERVQTEFDKLASYIKDNSEKHHLECNKVIDKLESLLLNHKIRGRSIMQDSPMQFVNVTEDFTNCGGTNDHLSVPKYFENLLKQSKPNNEEELININYPSMSKTYNVAHPEALYLQEILALPPKNPPNIDKRRRAKIKTMGNSYHLISSIMSICDDNDEALRHKREEIARREERARRERALLNASLARSRKRQTLHDTLLVMPKCEDPDRLLEVLENTESSSDYPLQLENVPSRWCSAIRSLQMMNNYQVLLNGDIRISNKTKEDPHTISSGGNFSPVVLGLDSCDRPLAVKRIKKDNSVCKIMKNLLNPLLGLRNTNLLHYFTCNYEENELVLATPLCEYNMGEYVMLMKQTHNMYVKSIDIVKQFLAGVRFLHDRIEPIVHGNLKPSNIFIDLNGTVRIAEFGMHKALYTLTEAPNTSVIWFSRETFTVFKETACIICTCASDIQVAGMLIHFMLTAGKHPYGETMQDILKNLERAIPQLITTDVDLHDLISWMLLYEPGERPTINQVLSHVFFWNVDRKWRFILAGAGISPHGTPLNIPLSELHVYINAVAAKENIKGRWINITKRRFPNLTYSKDDQDSITGLLRFIRNCMQNQVTFHINGDYEFRNFILSSFPALPLSLYRILESSQWLNHRVLQPFTTVDSLSA